MSDWSGSGEQRREQGDCRPVKQWIVIPAGTEVLICNRHERRRRWVKHTTRIRLQFEAIKHADKEHYELWNDDWSIRVRIARTTTGIA